MDEPIYENVTDTGPLRPIVERLQAENQVLRETLTIALWALVRQQEKLP